MTNFLCGLVASGKSTWAENNKERLNAVIHSSDAIREELGDINDQSQNELVFNTLHKRVKEDLLNGKNVIYDSTGLKRKNRLHLLSNVLKDVPCEKVCVLFATPYEICLKNNASRDRKVPEHVISRMYKNFEVPCYAEKWDDIQIVWYDYEKDGMKFNFYEDLELWRTISHNNPHHTLSIGDHMIVAHTYYCSELEGYKQWYKHIYDGDKLLSMAIIMHDCGKPFTKAFINSHNEPSETAHFYQHHLIGSYLSLFYLKELGCFLNEDILHISLLIGLHMQPFLAYDKSEKAEDKDRKLFGDTIVDQVLEIHKYDLAAH